MSQATFFINCGEGSLQKALEQVFGGLGSALVKQLVSEGDVEADIAFTNSDATAFSMMKDTVSTTIVLGYYSHREAEVCNALAARFPARMVTMDMLADGEKGFFPLITKLIAEKGEKGTGSDANPAAR